MLPLGIGRALAEERVGRVLSIEPLTVDELAELVRARLGTSFPPAILHGMHETSGGNPFFALEIARATLRGDTRATGQALPIPRNLRDDLVRDRVGSLPSFVQELLLYASACARPTVELLEAALERSPVDAPLADAVDAGILERDGGTVAFTHPIFRSAIYADSSREHRHRVHRRLSEVMDDGEERARHLALAADGPDEAAASALEEAAGRARARGSTAGAAELCELAERLTPPDRVADVLRLRGAAAEYRLLSGDYDAASPPRVRRVHRSARCRSRGSAPPAGTGPRGPRRRTPGRRRPDPGAPRGRVPAEVRSSIHMWRSTARLARRPAGALDDAEEALRLARSVDDPGCAGRRAHGARCGTGVAGTGHRRAMMAQTLELEASTEPRPVARRPSCPRRGSLGQDGRDRREPLDVHALLVEAVVSGDDDAGGLLHAELGWVEFLAGIGKRRSTISRAVGPAPDRGAARSVGAGRGPSRRCRRGRIPRDGSDRGSARSGAVDAELLALSALGALELSLGNASGARDHLERAWQLYRVAGFGEPAMFPFVADHAMALIELGADDATEVVEWLEERGRALQRPWALAAAARARALLAATHGDLAAAFEALAHALEEHERVAMPFELGANPDGPRLDPPPGQTEAPGPGCAGGSHPDLRAAGRAVVGRAGASRARADRWTATAAGG